MIRVLLFARMNHEVVKWHLVLGMELKKKPYFLVYSVRSHMDSLKHRKLWGTKGVQMGFLHIQDTVFNLLSVHALISLHPLFNQQDPSLFNLTSVEQPKCRHLMLNNWHHFSVVQH